MDAFSANTAFALHLYNAFAAQNEGRNFLLSPVSIFATLSMLLPGAKHHTLSQMLDAMKLNSANPMEKTAAELGRMLAKAGPSTGQLLMANKAFIESGYQVRHDYLSALKSHFNAEIASADFSGSPDTERQRINDWVKAATNGKIADLLTPGSVSSLTRLVLTNALYFKAKWRIPFEPHQTRPADFETRPDAAPVQVPMMHRMGNWPIVYVPDRLTGIRFDFDTAEGDAVRLSLMAVLPAERHGLDALMSGMSQADWISLVNAPAESSKALVAMPRVRLAGRAELSENAYLPTLGLSGLFSGDADLSGIASVAGDLHVSSFAHEAALEWDETGAEGAAASAAVVNTRSMPPQFRFDQPFLVVLAAQTGEGAEARSVPIFVGRVSDPTAV